MVTKRKRILVVDDSEDMRQLLRQILEEEGECYDVSFAEDGMEAIDQVQRVCPDLVLMDMSLPGMSGWDAVMHLRKIPGYSSIPIVAITAHVSRSDQERAYQVGCDAHLGKPFDVTGILDVLDRFLQ